MQPEQAPATPTDQTDLIENNDQVLAVVHKHWIGAVVIYAIAVLTIVTLIVLGVFVMPGLQLSSENLKQAVAVAAVAATILVGIVFVIVYIYEQSELTLTDKSLVQLVQRGLFNKKISRLSMSNVEDVNVEQRGIMAHIFNYGTLTVQTAGEEDNFVFSQCPRANVYAEQILEARQAYARQHNLE